MSMGVVFVKLVSYPGGDMGPQRPLPAKQAGLEIFRFPWMLRVKWCQQITPGEYVTVSPPRGFCHGLLHWGHSSSAGSLAVPYLPAQTCVLTSRETEPCAWDVDKQLAR